MSDNTTSTLISSVKRKALLPTGMISDSDIVEFMDDELHSAILPFLMRLREDYFATWVDFTTGGTNIFEIPTDAIGAKLKDVVFYLAGYQEAFVNVTRLTIEELSANRYDSMRPYGFYILGNKLYFYPQNAASGQTLRMYYYKRINHLTPITDTVNGVEVNYACKITSILGNAATVDIIPDGWTLTTEIDVIKGTQNYDVTSNSITDITGNVITLGTTGPAVGDYICVKGDTVYPQIPQEVQILLVQATVIKILEAMKDVQGLKIAAERYAKMEDDLQTLLTPRIDGECKKIVGAGGIWDYNKISTRRPWG